jgi:hypothetical protein
MRRFNLTVILAALTASMIFRPKSCGIASESDPQNWPPKEVKNLGAAELRYVLQSPGLVENCAGTLRTFVGI